MLAVMKLKSVNKAASSLNISQPALTKSIQRLEERLGVPLFERTAHGMSPTMYAHSLSAFAQAASVGLSKSLKELQSLNSGAVGTVTVAAPPSIAVGPLVEALAHLRLTHPNIEVRIQIRIEDIFPSLEQGVCDLVFAMIPRGDNRFVGLMEAPVSTDEIVIIMRPDHPLHDRTFVEVDALANVSWVLSPFGNILRQRLEQIHEACGMLLPKVAVECNAPEVVKGIVKQTDYLGWVSYLSCKEEVDAGTLAMARIDSPLTRRVIGVFWREYYFSPAARVLKETIERVSNTTPFLPE